MPVPGRRCSMRTVEGLLSALLLGRVRRIFLDRDGGGSKRRVARKLSKARRSASELSKGCAAPRISSRLEAVLPVGTLTAFTSGYGETALPMSMALARLMAMDKVFLISGSFKYFGSNVSSGDAGRDRCVLKVLVVMSKQFSNLSAALDSEPTRHFQFESFIQGEYFFSPLNQVWPIVGPFGPAGPMSNMPGM